MAKVVIVTGGSRGIRAATCRLAARRGYAVCVNYVRNREAADTVAADCLRAGGKAIAVQADVAVEADVVRLFETTDRELPGPRRERRRVLPVLPRGGAPHIHQTRVQRRRYRGRVVSRRA